MVIPKAFATFQQALRADRPPTALGFATASSLPATQGQRWAEIPGRGDIDKAKRHGETQVSKLI